VVVSSFSIALSIVRFISATASGTSRWADYLPRKRRKVDTVAPLPGLVI